jgi:SAM-dependent methyltransferase
LLETMRAFGLGDEDLTARRESGLGEDAFDDWLIDRTARRPSGSRAPAVYGAEGAAVLLADAGELPFDDDTFTAIAMSVVFFFLDEPLVVLGECRRGLQPRGCLAIYTPGPDLRGTPAAPEPVASHGHFYTDEELVGLAFAAGLRDPMVYPEDGAQLLVAYN